MKKYKIGLIGLGGVADVHLTAYKEVTHCEVVAGADIFQDVVDTKAKFWGFTPYTDYLKMLASESIDIVVVMTPALNHRQVVVDCAKSGVNILCEKPLTLDSKSAVEMMEICKKNNVKLMYGSSYRWLTACQEAKSIIQSGKLGNVQLLMEHSIGGNGLKGFKDAGDHHYPRGGPGGGMMGFVDHGIHFLDIFPWLIGSPITSVFGRGNISGGAPETEYISLFFENGAIGQLIYNEITYSADLPSEGIASFGGSWDAAGNLVVEGSWASHPGNFRIHGEKGALRIYHYAQQLFLFEEGKITPIPVQHRPMPGNFGLQLEAFIQSIESNSDVPVSGQDGLRAICVLEALYRSRESKKVEEVQYIL